jgi:hypothetical protein
MNRIKSAFLPLVFIMLTALLITACGAEGDASSPTRVSKGEAPQLVEPSDHGGGRGWQRKDCYLCHHIEEVEDIHEYNSKLSDSFGYSDTGVCLYCHGTNGLANVTADTYKCLTCHADSRVVDSHAMFGGKNMHDFDGDGKIGNSDCVVCHSWSDMNGTADINVDFSKSGSAYADTNAFCLNCHDGNGAFGIMPPVLIFDKEVTNIYSTYKGIGATAGEMKSTSDIHGSKVGRDTNRFGSFRGSYTMDMEVPCLSCHQVHSSDNPYLITESGKTAVNADAAAKNAKVSVTESNLTELCVVCHMNPAGADSTNGLKEVVHTSTYSSDCTNCHFHGAGHGTSINDLF